MVQRRELSEAQEAMLEHMAYLNYSEDKPACWQDFALFEANNKQYKLKYGTIRNNLSYLKHIGKIRLVCKDINSFYCLVECGMTTDQASVEAPKRDHNKDLTALIDRMPFDTPAVHDIHLRFHAPGLWDSLSLRSVSVTTSPSVSDSQVLAKILPRCKDIILPAMELDAGRTTCIVTVHKTDVAIVRIACSKKPIPLDNEGLLYLNRSIISVYNNLCAKTYNNLFDIPHPDTWTITLWHLGRDSLQRYNGKSFEITLQEFNGELMRTYSKSQHIRIERQHRPDIRLGDLMSKKLSVGAGV